MIDHQSRRRAWEGLQSKALLYQNGRSAPKQLAEAERFDAVTRQTQTQLARLRAFSPDRKLVAYLERVVAAATFALTVRRRPRLGQMVSGLVLDGPAAIRRLWAYNLASFLIVFGCAGAAFVAVVAEPGWYWQFMPEGLLLGRSPESSAADLRDGLFGGESSLGEGTSFSAMLFGNNTRVAFLTFGLGVLCGVPTVLILAMTGLMLGGFLGLYASKGLLVEVGAWLAAHGVPEIGAIVLCGGAGLAIGHRVISPGDRPRGEVLRETGTLAVTSVLACVPMLAVAGVVEGIYRQTDATIADRYLLATALLAALVVWIGFAGRSRNVVTGGSD